MSYVLIFTAFVIIFPPVHEKNIDAGMICDINYCYDLEVKRDEFGNISRETIKDLEKLYETN